MYYRGAQVVIAGFDVTHRYTLDGCDRWIKELHEQKPDCLVVAVGNKIDLAYSREVSTEEACAHFEAMNPPVPYFETSAKTGEGVNELFEAVTRMAIEGKTFDATAGMNNNENVDEDDKKGARGEKCIIC